METERAVDFLMEAGESFERSLNRMSGSIFVLQTVLSDLYMASSPEVRSAVKLKLLSMNLANREPNPDFAEGVLLMTRVMEKDML